MLSQPTNTPASQLPPPDLTIDCGTCVMRNTQACDDCLVTHICDRQPDVAVVISLDEYKSMRLLSEAGLLPGLRHETADESDVIST